MIFVDTSFWVALRNRRDSHHTLALRLFDNHAARGLVTSNPFVDATSFAVMRAAKIREALAFDGDFAAAGFIELRD